MISYYYRDVKDHSFKKSAKFKAGSWAHVTNPTDEDKQQLVTTLNLADDLVHDALDVDEMPRLQTEEGTTYVFCRFALKNGSGRVTTAPILLAVGANFFASVSADPCAEVEQFTKKGPDFETTDRARMLLEVFEIILETYSTQLNAINRKIRTARSSLSIAKVSNKDFVQFVEIEDILNEMLGDLVPTNVVLQTLSNPRRNLRFYDDDKEQIEDIILTAGQLIDSIKGSLKTIVNIREAYSNIATNNLNRQIKLLTTLTVVLTIPTIVGSFFGMNVPIPLHQSHFAFFEIVVASTGVSAFILFMFKKSGWL